MNINDAKTWKQVADYLSDDYDVEPIYETKGIRGFAEWCRDNLPELDRIYAMEKAIEAQQDEIDSLVRQLKGDSE
jgi:hypothetical protein